MKIEKVFLTKEALVKIKQIDDRFYIDVPNIEWYLERYNENHYAYCLFDNNAYIFYSYKKIIIRCNNKWCIIK